MGSGLSKNARHGIAVENLPLFSRRRPTPLPEELGVDIACLKSLAPEMKTEMRRPGPIARRADRRLRQLCRGVFRRRR